MPGYSAGFCYVCYASYLETYPSLKITNDRESHQLLHNHERRNKSNQNMPSIVVRSSQASKRLFPPTVCDKCEPVTLFILEHTLYHSYLFCHIHTEHHKQCFICDRQRCGGDNSGGSLAWINRENGLPIIGFTRHNNCPHEP